MRYELVNHRVIALTCHCFAQPADNSADFFGSAERFIHCRGSEISDARSKLKPCTKFCTGCFRDRKKAMELSTRSALESFRNV